MLSQNPDRSCLKQPPPWSIPSQTRRIHYKTTPFLFCYIKREEKKKLRKDAFDVNVGSGGGRVYMESYIEREKRRDEYGGGGGRVNTNWWS